MLRDAAKQPHEERRCRARRVTSEATMSEERDCLFCRILAGEVPSTEVLSTESTYAFRDINPGAPTHVLVIPREHVTSAAEITEEHGDLLADLVRTAQQVAAQ